MGQQRMERLASGDANRGRDRGLAQKVAGLAQKPTQIATQNDLEMCWY